MVNITQTRVQRVYKYASILVASAVLIFSLIMSHNYVYNEGVMDGVVAYHAQCLVGGYLIDDQGQAVVCGPLSKAPSEEKQTYKDKVVAPSLFK